MSKWKIWLGLFVVFASGVLIGGVSTRLYLSHRITKVLSGESPHFRKMFLFHLTHEINLSEEQRATIEQIADRATEAFRSLRKEHRSEVDAIFNQAVSDMKEHLSLEQQEQLDRIHEKFKKHHRRYRHHRHPPHPGPAPYGGKRGPPPHRPLPPPPPPPPPPGPAHAPPGP